MKLTATQIYEKLISQRIFDYRGIIQFHFNGINITINHKDVVGNILQEWLKVWLDQNSIDYALGSNTQTPPDFYLDPDDKEHNLLEVKAFNYKSSPAFDIADFRMYAREIIDHPYILNADYLIFGYTMDETGNIFIENIWLKKIWEITRRADKYPLFLQRKDKQIHKIRPATWYKSVGIDFSPFDSLEAFLSAVEQTIHDATNLGDKIDPFTWRNTFLESYRSHYGKKLSIPRWEEIEDKYNLQRQRNKAKAIKERDLALEGVEKNQERVLRWEKELAAVRTVKQKLKAEESLNKAKAALTKAKAKLKAKQKALNSFN